MQALAELFVFCQALGAIGGALSAVWGELSYARAIKDGHIDHAERMHLRSIAHGLRYGMSLLLIASFGLVVMAYVYRAPVAPALTASYWTLIALSLLVIGVTWALSRRRIAFAIGSAAAFTGWWFLVFLAFGKLPALTFGAAIALYVVAAAILYAVLLLARALITPHA